MPNDDGGVSKAVAASKAALSGAQSFSSSASGHATDPMFAHPAHQTGVSFAAQHGADHTGGLAGEASSAAAGIASKQANVAAYKASGN